MQVALLPVLVLNEGVVDPVASYRTGVPQLRALEQEIDLAVLEALVGAAERVGNRFQMLLPEPHCTSLFAAFFALAFTFSGVFLATRSL